MTIEPLDPTAFVVPRFETSGGEIVCRFYRPRFDGQDYRCDYEVEWPHRRGARYATGVDSVQALLLAMEVVHADLLTAAKRDTGKITWLKQDDLGLPLSESMGEVVES